MSDFLGDIVIIDLIDVGGGGLRFAVHKNILCRTSKYFTVALKREWRDSRSEPHILKMRDIVPEAMERWIRWLYTTKIALDTVPAEILEDSKRIADYSQDLYIKLAHDVKLSERVLDDAYQLQVIQTLVWVKNTMIYAPGPACASIIYSGTLEGNPARKLLTSIVVAEAWDDSAWTKTWTNFMRNYPPEMLSDISIALLQLRQPGTFSTDPRSWDTKSALTPIQIEFRQRMEDSITLRDHEGDATDDALAYSVDRGSATSQDESDTTSHGSADATSGTET